MTDTAATPFYYSPSDDEPVVEFFTTRDDAKNHIRAAIEGGGAVAADTEFDIDAICAETFTYSVDTDGQGRELLNTAGFRQSVTGDQFWEIVAKHDRTAEGQES